MPRHAEAILDDYLVLQAMDGVPDAWRQLVAAWHPLLVRRATRLLIDPHEAADAVQDTWVSVARSLGRLEDPGRFAPWLYCILARRCADRVSVQRRRIERSNSSRVCNAAAEIAARERESEGGPLGDLRSAMRQLPADQRVLLSIRYAEEMPIRIIAEMLGIAEGTVKSRLSTAREALRALVETDDRNAPQ